MKSKRHNNKIISSRIKKHNKSESSTRKIKSKQYKKKSTKTKQSKHIKLKNIKGGAVIGKGGFGCAIDSLSESLILDQSAEGKTITKLFTGGSSTLRITKEKRDNNIINDFSNEINIFSMLNQVNANINSEIDIFDFLPRMLNHIKITKKPQISTNDNEYTIYKGSKTPIKSKNEINNSVYDTLIGTITKQNNENIYNDINYCLGSLEPTEFYGIQMNKLGNCDIDGLIKIIFESKSNNALEPGENMVNIIQKLRELFIKTVVAGLIHNDIKSDNVRLSIEGIDNCQNTQTQSLNIKDANFYLIDVGYITNYFINCVQYQKEEILIKEYTINIINETARKYENIIEDNMINYDTIDILLHFSNMGSPLSKPPEINIYLLICLAYCIKQVLENPENPEIVVKAKEYIGTIETAIGIPKFNIDELNLEYIGFEFKTIFSRVLIKSIMYYNILLQAGDDVKKSVFDEITQKIIKDAKEIRSELIRYLKPNEDMSPEQIEAHRNTIFKKYNKYLKNYLIGEPDNLNRKLPGIFTKDLYSYAVMISNLPQGVNYLTDEDIKSMLGTNLLDDYPRGRAYMNSINELKVGTSCAIPI
jgi:hypothetical protein